MDETALNEALAYYAEQGAPGDQQMLAALLREVQQQSGGVLRAEVLSVISRSYGVNCSLLRALISRIPSLRMEDAPHRLEMCSTCAASRALAQVAARLSREQGGFEYCLTPCMKNCKNGPSIRWDGKLHSHADEELLRKLISGK